MDLFARAAIGLASLIARVYPRPSRPAETQQRLERAVAALDRELAGDLELVVMFMQTKQPAVLDNAAYNAWRAEIAAADADVGARLDVLYERMPDAESAMERRGPAGSIAAADRAMVQRWEGEARTLQRGLRALASSRPRSAGDRLLAWTRARVGTRTAAE